jgi:hypothetical protein
MSTLRPVDLAIPLTGLAFTTALFVAGFGELGQGCLAGAVLVSLDWLLLRVLFKQILARKRMWSLPRILSVIILGFKFIFLAFFIYLAINRFKFNPYGMAVGISALPLGIIAGSVVATRGVKLDKD